MTLDEMIAKATKDAEILESATNGYPDGDEWVEEAKKHRQLAELLKELKAYREADEEINRRMKSGQWSDAVVYGMGKALFIMHKHIREVNADDRN